MTWQTINRILNRNNKKKEGLPDTFREKNSNVNYSDPIEIANKFNEYFVNVGPNLAKGIQQNDTIPFEIISKVTIEKVCLLNLLQNMKS